MDDLVQFLRDRLDEDERAAKRVESSWRQVGETGVIVASDGDRAEECANGNWTGIAEHIVRHDPARTLREVEAKRRLLYQFENRGNSVRAVVKPSTGGVWDDLLRLLALPYSGHEDYREDWKP